MSKVNAGQASSTLIPKYIGSDFDKVVAVADNIEQVVIVGDNIEDVGTVADNINYVKEVAEDLHGMPVTMYTGENPPVLNPMPEGVMWYCTTDGRTYVWYTDADSGQWVESAPQSAMKDEATNIFFHSTHSNVNPAYRNATLYSTPAPEAEISVAHNALNTPVVQAQFIREEALWVDVSVIGAQGIVTLMGYSSGSSQLKAEIITWKNGAEGTSLGASQWVTLPSQPSVVSLPVTLANIDVLDAGDSYVVKLTSQMNAGGSAVSTILVDGNTNSRFGIIFNTSLIGLNDGIRDGVITSAPTENAVYDALQLKVGKNQLVQSGNLTSTANWANVPAYSDSELGGSDGPLNAQAKALTARSELLLTDVREALRRSYAEAGYDLIGTFSNTGLVVDSATDAVLWEPTGVAYAWTGALPHTITAGETPIGNPSWVSKSNTKSGLIYASSFATQNVQVSQDVALQTGLNEAVRLQVPFVIDGEYWLTGFVANKYLGVVVPSNAHIKFLSNAAFKIIPNSSSGYSAITIQQGVENITIEDPCVIGDRLAHTYVAGSTHEWGYGITIYESRNVKILRPRVSQMTGDGIYVGRRWGSTSYDVPTDILIDHPVIHHCRRNGMSPTSVDSCSIVNPDIYAIGNSDGIEGAWPKACIDIEPESADGALLPSVRNLKIYNPRLHDSRAGLYLYGFKKPEPYDFQVRIIGTCEVFNVSTGVGIYLNPANNIDVHFDKVLIGPGIYASFELATGSSGSVKTVIDEIEFTRRSDILLLNNALEPDDMRGGLRINKITQTVESWSTAILNKDPINGRKWDSFYIDPDRRINFILWSTDSQPDYNRESVHVFAASRHTGWSVGTTKYTNKIWQDPSIDTAGTTLIYLNSRADTRVLEVGLYIDSARVGMGCNIQIAGAMREGVLYKTLHTKTPGSWIRFQNVGGKTNILDMFGEWTFANAG